MNASIIVCSAALFAPHIFNAFIPSFPISALISSFWFIFIWFPMFCGTCKGNLIIGFFRIWKTSIKCAFVLLFKVSFLSILFSIPFNALFYIYRFRPLGLELEQSLSPYIFMLVLILSVLCFLFVCVKWMPVAFFAHLSPKKAFYLSKKVVKYNYMKSFMVLILVTVGILLIIPTPFVLLKLSNFYMEIKPAKTKQIKTFQQTIEYQT